MKFQKCCELTLCMKWHRRSKLTACLMVKLQFRLGRISEKPLLSTLHCTLENESNLYVNKCQKIRHYHGRYIEEEEEEEEERRMPNRDFLLRAVRT